MSTALSTRRLLLRSSRCFLIASGPPRWSAPPEPPVAPTTLIYGAPKQQYPAFSSCTLPSWRKNMLRTVREESRRLSSSTSDSDDDEEKDDNEEDEDASSSNQKVLLYACYGINDWHDICQRDFMETAMKEETDVPKEDANDFSDFSFSVEADLYSLDDIFAKAKDQFGTAQDLQYYHIHDREWRSLTNHEELDAFQTYCFAWVLRPITEDQPCPLVVPIRIPQFFQDEEDDELGPEGETGVQTPHAHNLEGMIEYLLYQLMKSEWQRVPVKDMDVTKTTVWRLQRALRPDEVRPAVVPDNVASEMTLSTMPAETFKDPAASEATSTPTDDVAPEMTLSTTAEASKDPTATEASSKLMEEEGAKEETAPKEAEEEKPQFYYMDTHDWVLQQAARDVKLRGLLMYYPHSLEHITECLHYSFLWDNFPRLKDGTPHPEGVSAVEDELPPGVERIVTTNDDATKVSSSSASNMSA